MKNKKGSVLLVSLFVTYTLLALVYVGSMRSMVELKSVDTSVTITEAFHVADGELDKALVYLKSADWPKCNRYAETENSKSQFSVTCLDSDNDIKRVGTYGQVTSTHTTKITRWVEGIVVQGEHSLFDSTLYVGDGLDVSGNTNLIDGNVTVTDVALVHPDANITGEITVDLEPITELDWDYLREVSESQNNVYTEATQAFMPTTFYYSEGVPNVVIFDDAQLNANSNTILGGFIIINPGDVGQFVQNGNIQLNGCIYVNGDMDFNGGGDRTINGCAWAADDIQLNGTITITDNPEYRNAIRGFLGANSPTLVSWREVQGTMVSDWTLLAYGVSGQADKFVTYRNPHNEQLVVQVFYDTTLNGNQVTGIEKRTYSQIDGSVIVEDGSGIYEASETYTGAGGL